MKNLIFNQFLNYTQVSVILEIETASKKLDEIEAFLDTFPNMDNKGNPLLGTIAWLVRKLISLRYKVEIKGLEKLTPDALSKSGGILFLPNHPAELDPVILTAYFWKRFHLSPIVVEHFYNLKGVQWLMDAVGALPIPNIEKSTSRWKLKKVEELFSKIATDLKKGGAFLIYPAGRLKLTENEIIGGASLVHNLLTECPQTNIVLVRTTGLWGSRFSRALTGEVPGFGRELWQGIKIIIKNGIFFAPRRKITIELSLPSTDFPWKGSRLELNRYLEQWYNRVPDPLTLVSESFWKEKFPNVVVRNETRVVSQEIKLPPEAEREILSKLSVLSRRPIESLTPKTHLALDLGLDSLDLSQIYVFLEEHYNVRGLTPGDLHTVEDLFLAASGGLSPTEGQKETSRKVKWEKEENRPSTSNPLGDTIPESFLRMSDRMGSHAACADALSGVLSYKKLKLSALILSEKIKKLPGEKVGIMLPSSVGAYVSILATHFAGKIPVMLNWTVGKRALDHGVDLCDLQTIITSNRFLDRLDNGDLGKVEERFVFLEDWRESFSLKDKLLALWRSWKGADSLYKSLGLRKITKESIAVILFTSGTEALPKAVPLTHNNILSNQRSALQCISFEAKDVLYGVLPPFHSFGFSVTGIFPLMTGIRVFYSPDPTDSYAMAREIEEWGATLFCCAPTFMKNLFRVAKPEQLGSVRLFVAGAEKTPQDLFDYVENLPNKATLLEGYGITECSPVVTLTRPGKTRIGVGEPLPGIELCIVDFETGKPLRKGEEGEICISGPNVFGGYIGHPVNPFLFHDDKKWYRSGDRGRIDKSGALFFSGRLKRFAKIGGEMVSLTGLEDELGRLALEKGWNRDASNGPLVAVTVKEVESEKPILILFSTFDISKEEVNTALKECGYGRIVKIAEVRRMTEIPVTGTGKTHYRVLEEL